MRRNGKWLFRMMRVLCGMLCGYILFEGTKMAAGSGLLEEAAARFCLPGITYADVKREKDLWAVLVRETMPVFFYWKQQEVYLPADSIEEDNLEESEEESLVVEETAIDSENLVTEAETREKAEALDTDHSTQETQIIETEATETEPVETEVPETEAVESETEARETEALETEEAREVDLSLLDDYDYLLNHYFCVDPSTWADTDVINREKLTSRDFTISKDTDGPQILIYHTHSQEMFADSTEGDPSTSIVGIGDNLTSLLSDTYGYQVVHDTDVYDLVNGVLDRSAAYDYALEGITKILKEYPTIEVIIDLHRDGVDGKKFVTIIDDKPTAMIMFFNGLSRSNQSGQIEYLPNSYTEDNLAFSFQLQLKAEECYPGLMRNIYLESLRYNLHLRPRSLLIEAGTQLNTVEEEKNAMVPLADILNRVLQGE